MSENWLAKEKEAKTNTAALWGIMYTLVAILILIIAGGVYYYHQQQLAQQQQATQQSQEQAATAQEQTATAQLQQLQSCENAVHQKDDPLIALSEGSVGGGINQSIEDNQLTACQNQYGSN